MRKITAIIMIFALSGCLNASMTKMYIGNENDQLIIGIEALGANSDGGAGLEIRTFFKKQGIVVDGTEYGSLPGKTTYTFSMMGKNSAGSFLKIRRNWGYSFDENNDWTPIASKSQIETGAGRGIYILYP